MHLCGADDGWIQAHGGFTAAELHLHDTETPNTTEQEGGDEEEDGSVWKQAWH